MKPAEIRAMSNAELYQELRNFQEELFRLRFQQATGKLTNTARMRQVKKDIARIKTILRQRELAQAEAAG
ncbi:MAG: 50S ribosomal protein L29 [Herpetosiphonaceae bacterium]|nr:MAG: 50S ribosomal protein L29 [Herpetosiphonaceae bacterium]